MSIRAVIFDFGNVICFPPTEEQWSEAAQFSGVAVADFKRIFWSLRDEYDRGGDPLAYWLDFAKLSGRNFDHAMIDGLIQREIAFWSHFDRRVLAWIDELRAAGIRTGILSNLPWPLAGALRATPGFLNHFDQVTFSCELGVMKPHPKIYQDAINGLAIAAADGLFLDDRPENIEGARAVGLGAELFNDWEDFRTRGPARYSLPEPLA
jgi:putative hydrolase of the HAD superfamily